MPKTTIPKTPDELRQQAARLDAEAGAVREELQRQAQEDHERRTAAQLAFDADLVAGFSRAALEAEVDQAKATLDAAVAANPLVVALSDYLTALYRRSHALAEHMSALSRLGRPSGPSAAVDTQLGGLDGYLLPAAQRLAGARIAAEVTDLHARREAAGDEAEAGR